MGQCVIQMGDNVYATVVNLGRSPNRYDYTTQKYSISISGTGDMYEKTRDFKRISANDDMTSVTFVTAWRGCVSSDGVFILSDGITSITNDCFRLNEDITIGNNIMKFIVGKDVKRIGNQAFQQDHYVSSNMSFTETGFRTLEFRDPTVLESIGDLAFFGNVNLQTIDFKGTKPTLGTDVFRDCENLVSTNFGKSMYLPYGVFYNCKKLVKFNEDNSISGFDNEPIEANLGCLMHCNSIEELSFDEDCYFKNDFQFTDESSFFVELGAGSNCDADGRQITRISGLSTWAICHPWHKLENRAVVMDSGRPFLALKHKGIVINELYPKPPKDQIYKYHYIKHKGRTWFIMQNRTTDMTLYQSPLIVRLGLTGINIGDDGSVVKK